MPRFYFDFRQGHEHSLDSEGAELDNVEQAYLEAYRGAQEMWGEMLRDRRDPRRCLFEVHDSEHRLLFVFPFQEVVDSCTDRRPTPIRHTYQEVAWTTNYATQVREDMRRELSSMRDTLRASRALLAEKV